MDKAAVVVVTGANGLVGARVCAALAKRDVEIRAVVRRGGTAPDVPGLSEWVGDFPDVGFAGEVLAGADVAITTVHPMAADLEAQHETGVEGTASFAQAAADADVATLLHISTCAVYDRSPEVGDVDETSPLVGDDAGDYAVTKRDADAALADVDGITRVLLRPPAILGPLETSVWNTLRPAAIRLHRQARHAVPDQTFAWVHVDDLAAFAADLATGAIVGPKAGSCTAVNLAGGPATVRDYYETVTAAVGVDPVWDDKPAWTGLIRTDLARSWGWQPTTDFSHAMSELDAGLRG